MIYDNVSFLFRVNRLPSPDRFKLIKTSLQNYDIEECSSKKSLIILSLDTLFDNTNIKLYIFKDTINKVIM